MLDPANWTARLNELNLAALTDSETEEQFLRPADSSGTGFVLRSHDDEPWVPLSFGQFGDGTPYISLSGRVRPGWQGALNALLGALQLASKRMSVALYPFLWVQCHTH